MRWIANFAEENPEVPIMSKRTVKPRKEIVEGVRDVIKDWRRTATELQIPHKLLGAYSMRCDEL